MNVFGKKTRGYTCVDLDLEDNEKAAFLDHQPTDKHCRSVGNGVRQPKQFQRSSVPWIISTIIFASLAIVSTATSHIRRTNIMYGAFPTDLEDARRAIEYEQRTFTGALMYDPDSKSVHRLKDAVIQYFGPPSAEINAAWAEILRDEFAIMNPEEAEPFLPDLKPLPKLGHFYSEPDMFHSLHCINALRLEVSKTLYPDADPVMLEHHHGDSKNHRLNEFLASTAWKQAHLEHCLDRIMQGIMCHGDLTPSPLYWWKGFPIVLGKSGQHTCRKFQPIRDWMDERNVNGTSLQGL